jgi:hypothetical protein
MQTASLIIFIEEENLIYKKAEKAIANNWIGQPTNTDAHADPRCTCQHVSM